MRLWCLTNFLEPIMKIHHIHIAPILGSRTLIITIAFWTILLLVLGVVITSAALRDMN